MQEVLFQYELNPTTWVYFSSLLTLAIFFKFSRLWSIRNVDLLGLIALAPGLLLISLGHQGTQRQNQAAIEDAAPPADATQAQQAVAAGDIAAGEAATGVTDQAAAANEADDDDALETAPAETAPTISRLESLGYTWLFVVGVFFLIRLLADPLLARRPLLEPNLTAGGLTFLALCLFVFLMANVITADVPEPPVAPGGDQAVAQAAVPAPAVNEDSPVADGAPPESAAPEVIPPGGEAVQAAAPRKIKAPGFTVLDMFPRFPSRAFGPNPVLDQNLYQGKAVYVVTGRLLTIFAHVMIVAGLIYLGTRYFNNYWTGIGMATLYLMLPYTAYLVGDLRHAAPGALLVWMIAAYRRPVIVGALLAVAIGAVYYPMFLVPLFVGFYWQRGVLRFAGGLIGTFAALLLLVALLAPPGFGSILHHFPQMFSLSTENLQGFWATQSPYLRIPLVALFLAMCCGMAIWPAQKNLGTLISGSAAIMLGTQFWYPQGGLLFMNWYLPLLLLTVFRPNLENRVAVAAIGERWNRRRLPPQAA